ncbi:MAG: transposase [Hymenobacter sp.]
MSTCLNGEQPGTGPKKPGPTAVILDTQSVKNAATATGATVGFDAGKLVKGRKRLVLTDTLGHVLASRVLPADAVDGPAAIAFWDEVAATHDLLGQVQVVFVDSSFNGVFREHLAQRYGIRVEKPAARAGRENEFLHSCLALDCRAHLRLAQRKPSIVKRIRPNVAPRQRLDYTRQHQTNSQILLTQTAAQSSAARRGLGGRGGRFPWLRAPGAASRFPRRCGAACSGRASRHRPSTCTRTRQ